MFLWSPKHENELATWLAEYFDKPVETFREMKSEQLWAVYDKVRPFDPPTGRWVSREYH